MEFIPDMRSVFFNSLKNNPNYNAVYTASKQIFDKNSLINTNGQFTSTIQQKYNQALKILQQGIIIEQNNEYDYFNSILNDKKLPEKIIILLKNKLDNIFHAKGAFQYNEFINIINNILLGEDQYRAVLKLEKERLGQLNSYVNVLKQKAQRGDYKNKTNSKGDNLGIIDKSTLESFLEKEYLEKHTLKTFRGEFKDLNSTVDNIISKFIDNIVLQCLKSNTTNQILTNIYNSGLNIESSIFVPQLINNIMNQLQSGDRISKLINATINKNKNAIKELGEEIINDTINNFQKILINNQNSNFGRKTKKTAAIKEIEEDNKLILKITGNNLAADLLQNENKLKQLSEDYFDLNITDSPVSTQLEQVKKLIAEGEQWARAHEVDLDKIPEEQQKAIRNAKSQLSKVARQTIENKLKDKGEEAVQSYLTLIQTALSSNVFHISGPTYSEIVDSIVTKIISNGETFWSGPKNLKADTVTITYDGLNLSSDILNNLIEENDLTSLMSSNAHIFYDSFQSHLPKTGEATNFSQGRLSWMRATYDSVQKLNQTIEESHMKTEEKLQAMKEVANIMKNTIIVTETMKTFDTYYEKLGFVSGSLGPNISAQLSNFQELFNSAGIGMTDTEATWLETAIVNCAPDALGNNNKGPIEKYLSTLAGFAVFDEGSAELELISQTASQFYLENSPKLLHLYKLNGLYFPGSYILSRIYENLTNTLNKLETQTINNDGVHISAHATEALIPKKEYNLQERWNKTYAAAKEVTSLDISFLSGLLNIVNQLLASFSNNF